MRVLQLCLRMPFPPREGGSLAMAMLAKGLADTGHELTILALNTSKHYVDPDSIPTEWKDLAQLHAVPVNNDVTIWRLFSNLFSQQSFMLSRFYTKAVEQRLIDLLETKDFDIVVLESLFMTLYLPAIKRHSKAKVVLRSHNVEHVVWERHVAAVTNPIKKAYFALQAGRLKRYELESLKSLDAILPITEEDKKIYLRLGYVKPLITLPFGMDIGKYPFQTRSTSNKPTVFFIGTMNWQPNAEGVLWFLKEVWPLILEQHPDTQFHIAGREMPTSIVAFGSDRVKVHGEINDPASFFGDHDILAAPLLSGGGIRIKILEGMAYGKAIVSTQIGMEGIKCQHDRDILIADDPKEFAYQIIRLLESETLIKEMGSEARKTAMEVYDYKRLTENMLQSLKSEVLAG